MQCSSKSPLRSSEEGSRRVGEGAFRYGGGGGGGGYIGRGGLLLVVTFTINNLRHYFHQLQFYLIPFEKEIEKPSKK